MALQGNPFLGKLKIPAPDLSLIPDAPFQNREARPPETNIKRAPTGQQTDRKGSDKSATKWQQTDNKPATTVSETGNKPITNRQQTGNASSTPIISKIEIGNKVATEPATLSATKWQQTDNKPTTTATFSALVGLQSALIVFLYQSCKAARSRCTNALTLEHMASCLGSSPGSVKTTLQRLEAKDYISRIGFKNGRGGWSKYELPDALFSELLQFETENKLATKWQQTDNKVGTKPATEPATSVPSSSSSIDLENFKTTTTSESDFFTNDTLKLSPEWEALDFSSLSEIGFTQSHLIQIARHGKVSAQDAQESIEFFSFDLKRNQKAKNLNGSALNFFMGILRKGIPYAPPENYENPIDEARRRKRDILAKLDAKRRAEESEIEEFEFQTWKATLTADQKKQLVPWSEREGSPGYEAGLREFFKNQRQAGEGSAEAQIISQQIESSLAITASLQGTI